ncbi:SDR family NAD(P)-dependent oxidoreductase [Mesoterricola silvestris]|uniref:Oxidoreductase n=1 Tax=Mesoterricola silvestris TaxID=2927979 RepID=A0AA48GQP1_9BACT|nr:SDR family NAD(P)-dependent oxidoreductase [Mesoterricola silvestris]BDU73945.1 oxidoreductase [Mesoterricola silvestris]
MANPLAVILGAGPGIGLAAALRFRREGFRVAMVARPGDDLKGFGRALDGGLVLGADLAEGVPTAAIEAWGGPPRVLVYNASAGAPGPAAELTPEQVMRDLQVNVAAALAGARWALPSMRGAGEGTLLFTGGGIGLKPQPGLASGSLGKAALRSLALSFAAELEPEGIHAATVTVRGFVQAGTALSPEAVAACFWDLHAQPRDRWERERVLPWDGPGT